ncbi:cysteine desulfurase family protein [Novosphingobium terrae]|uniref:cysteine desulfurase family protein n=1 Tax=Novosphingobium terrae TaxID=2726189 RepID=UPI00197DFACD|nr:cysteine desulfurase family protein [Novosphingobium terrae]
MIYLDYQATTPLAPQAREVMLHWLGGPETTGFANPHSPHRPGRGAAAAVAVARDQVAGLFPPGGKVIFTSGATEAINLAIKGVALNGRSIAHSAIEHSAVLDTVAALGGGHVLPVGANGLVAQDVALPETLGLLAVMQVNNEIGTVQPVDALAARAHAMGALMLVDGVQGAGKMPPPLQADMIAVSAHKIYGPKGIGALWVRDGLDLTPLLHGGGQEGGLRSGTLSPALCAGFGAAAALCQTSWESDGQHVDSLWKTARAILHRWTLNGDEHSRWHGNLNLRLDGLDVARLMSDLRDIAFSAGSACASGSGRPSHVLAAIGLTAPQAKNSIRIGFGRYTDPGEFAEALQRIDAAAQAQGA